MILKKIIYLFVVFVLSTNAFSQNMLPLDWNIDFISNLSVNSRKAKQHSVINTLLSWERQGYFSGDGDCMLSASFNMKNIKKTYLLNIRMQCVVNGISINGKIAVPKIKNIFKEDTYQSFIIPGDVLIKGKNKIVLNCSSLGYTGGVSNTLLELRPYNDKYKENVRISLPEKDHVCLDNNKFITIHYHAVKEHALLKLNIETDFHQQILDSTFIVSNKDSMVTFDLNKFCKSSGFYQLTAILHGEGYSGNAQWLTVQPEKVLCGHNVVNGFNEYWSKAMAELSGISPDFKLQKVDSLCRKSHRDVYIVEMKSLNSLTVRGYYFVPRTEGVHPAVLQVPGYGWGFENIEGMLNDKTNRIELALCVRGHGISADVFNPGFGTPGIWGYKLYDKDSLAYRGIYMDCVRAVDFLCSRSEVDTTRIAVKGGSQGGGLALATAALCSDRIAACAYFDPFPCDMRHQIKIRTTCETELKNDLAYYGNTCSFQKILHNQNYIDTASFAPNIKCRVLFTTALFDDDCPVHVGFTAYNLIKSKKQYKVYPHDGHIQGFSHDDYIMKWLDDTLK